TACSPPIARRSRVIRVDDLTRWVERAQAHASGELEEATAVRRQALRDRRAGRVRQAEVREREAGTLERAAQVQQSIANELRGDLASRAGVHGDGKTRRVTTCPA